MKIKVLLVDDEKDFVEVLSQRLKVRDLDVKTALSGDQALTRIQESEFDVIVLDVLIPGMDGIKILKEIKNIRPLIHVIMLTGHARIATAVRGMELGAYDYLIKPIEIEELTEKIKMAHHHKTAQDDRERQEEVKGIVRKRGRNRFLAPIYDFFRSSR